MTRKMMVTQYIRAQAWWQLDTPGLSAIRVARSVVALLDAAACIAELPEDHPDLEELDRAGCFRTGTFDPGATGQAVVRGWELADEPTGTEQDLLGTLAVTVSADRGVPSPAPRRAAETSSTNPAAPRPDGYPTPGRYVPQPADGADPVLSHPGPHRPRG